MLLGAALASAVYWCARLWGRMTKRSESRPDDRAVEAKYANYLEVGHNPFEFRLDFGQHDEDEPGPHVHSRIITNPVYAKAFVDLLRNAVASYEETFGPIRTLDDSSSEDSR